MLNNMIENNEVLVLKEYSLNKVEFLKSIEDYLIKIQVLEENNDFIKKIIEREEIASTGFGNEIAIPHSRLKGVLKNFILPVVLLENGIEWNAIDKKEVKYFFFIIVSIEEKTKHIELLGELSNDLMDENKINYYKRYFVANNNRYLAVSACTFGLAHTYLVESKLEKYAKEHNFNIKIETHGAKGDLNIINDEDLKSAEGVIIAVDKDLDLTHIKHKNIIKVRTSDVLKNIDLIFEKLNNRKNNNINYFFKTKTYSFINSGASLTTNFIGFSILFYALITFFNDYILNLGESFNNTLISSFMVLSKLGPILLTTLLVYKIAKKDTTMASITAVVLLTNCIYYSFLNIGVFGGMLFLLIISIIYLPLIFLLKKYLINSFIYSPIKWVLKIFVAIAIFTIMFFLYNEISSWNEHMHKFFSNLYLNYWYFNAIIAFLFIFCMLYDLGGIVNKWSLTISGIIMFDTFAYNFETVWMIPITATSIAIVAPNCAAWIRGILYWKVLDLEEKQAVKKSYNGIMKCLTEEYIYFQNKYKWKALLANFIFAIELGFIIGFINFEFYGGMNNFLGIIFSFTKSNITWIPNVGFVVVTLTMFIIGGITHAVIYPPKKEKNQKNEKMKNTLYSSNTLR